MSFFTSSREKRLWIYASIVLFAIFLSLFFSSGFEKFLYDQNIQAIFFLICMGMVAVTVIIHGIEIRFHKTEIAAWFAILTVYLLIVLRVGLPERSHLIEYSVLTILIHRILMERRRNGKKIPIPAVLAFIISFIIGVFDEVVQLFIPMRVFDPVDMVFNGLAALMAMVSTTLLMWIQKRLKI